MASTIFDVPALDVPKATLAVSTGLRTPKLPIHAGSVNRQCMLLIGYGACKNCWPERLIHCILNWDITPSSKLGSMRCKYDHSNCKDFAKAEKAA